MRSRRAHCRRGRKQGGLIKDRQKVLGTVAGLFEGVSHSKSSRPMSSDVATTVLVVKAVLGFAGSP